MLIDNARRLRSNMTDAEAKLWHAMRNRQLGYKIRRQMPIGNYIADFACEQRLLIIEADGGQHCENSYDVKRTAYLESQGWRVVRFWNNEVLENFDAVLGVILKELAIAPDPAAFLLSAKHSSRFGKYRQRNFLKPRAGKI